IWSSSRYPLPVKRTSTYWRLQRYTSKFRRKVPDGTVLEPGSAPGDCGSPPHRLGLVGALSCASCQSETLQLSLRCWDPAYSWPLAVAAVARSRRANTAPDWHPSHIGRTRL